MTSKPENVLLDAVGHVRLADFGTCVFMEEGRDALGPHACERAFVGSAQYVAPEVVAGALHAAVAQDVWGLGCVAHYVAAGADAFARDTDYLTWQAVLGEPAPELLHVEPAYAHVVQGCLHKDPAQRAPLQWVIASLDADFRFAC